MMRDIKCCIYGCHMQQTRACTNAMRTRCICCVSRACLRMCGCEQIIRVMQTLIRVKLFARVHACAHANTPALKDTSEREREVHALHMLAASVGMMVERDD